MATNSRGTNQTSTLYLHNRFTFDKSLQQPLPPPLYAPPQALPTEEASSQTCADPRQPSMYPICFNNLHTKNGMREIGSHNWHFSWLAQIKQQQVACPSALLPWQDLHLAIEFPRPLPQPFFWILLVLPALLISFNQTTKQHFETSACLPSTICCRKSWHNYIFRTWTRFNVWGPPFPSKDKVFSTNHVKKMCQGRNGHQQQGHQSDIYTVSTQSFHFWQESPAASSSATLRCSSSLA